MNIDQQEINEKAEELKAQYLADDDFFLDAIVDSASEIRAILNADCNDDRLAAIDALKAKINKSIYDEQKLIEEAIDAIKESRIYDINYNDMREAA